MGQHHFETLTRVLTNPGTRRRLLAGLAATPLVGALLAGAADEGAAKDRRRRRKRRHKKRKHPGSRKGKGCKPKGTGKVCAGRCGTVQNRDTCGKRVDCGPCPCNPPCDACSTCDTATLTCVTSCSATEACCDGACLDVQENPRNCGGCGIGCADNEMCVDGACEVCDVTCQGETCVNTDVQTALAQGGTVYVCPGRYTGNLTINLDASLIGAGTGDDDTADTIFDALGSGNVVINDTGVTASLRRLRITGGSGNNGAGVQNLGFLAMIDCTVTGNGNAGNQGGGILTDIGGNLEMTGCTVSDNSASGETGIGGGLMIGGPATLTNCTIGPDNTAGRAGGGIHVLLSVGGPLTLNNCTVTGNSAPVGGGIENDGALVTLNGGRVTGNTAPSSSDILNFGTLIDNGATIGECTDLDAGCGCPDGAVCP